MRVLHTIGEMGTGGAESLVVELVRRGRDVGWVSAVASAGGLREEELRADGFSDFHRVPLSRRRPDGLARAVAATRAAVQATDPDVVLSHNVGVTVATWLALRSLARTTPIATVFHGVAARDYRPAALALSVAPRTVVTVSSAISTRLREAGLHRQPIVIPNAITAPVLPDRATARAQLDLAADVPVALCAARLVAQKRHDVLLRAWAATSAATERDAVLLLAGDGPERDHVENLVGSLRLTSRVRVLGSRDDVPRLLAAADLFTLSSDWEGLPIALLEAMASGRPVVATSVDGVTEVLEHGGGLVVPPCDPAALATAIDALLTDISVARTTGATAARVIREHYDPAVMMRRYDELLRSIVARAGRADKGASRP
jgi:glycosyltransferase involved in cell wall biosynthesis